MAPPATARGRLRRCLVLVLAVLLPGPLIGPAQGADLDALAAPESPCAAASALPPAHGVSAASLVPSYPPCFDVELVADSSGKPPLEHRWTLPDGTVLAGNPVVLDTGLLADGFSQVRLDLTNDYGTASAVLSLVVESLGFSSPPLQAAADGLTVQFRAASSGATAWRWHWGDGTVSPWLEGCAGLQPSHAYPAAGTYDVVVEIRNCRAGPLASARVPVTVGEAAGPQIDAFETPCGTYCFVSVGDPVRFDLSVSGATPDTYLYDWDGDLSVDEISDRPIAEHVYWERGWFIPRVTVRSGLLADSASHPGALSVEGDPDLVFRAGFESGTLSSWSYVLP